MRITGLLTLGLFLLLAVRIFVNLRQLAEDQAMMIKTDEELIGTHFYVPRDGKDDVDVNLYMLEDETVHPVVFNIHGGAFIAGDADAMDTQSDRISKSWGVQVVSINYSLAVNGVSIEDGTQEIVDTVLFFREHATEYHIASDQIYIMGYSAGGYHAMASVLKLKEINVDVAGQILCYSFLRDTLNRYEKMTAEQQSDLAPALFVIAEGDPIGEGSLQYEEALRSNSISTQILTYRGALHGFIEENNPEYETLHSKASKSPEQEQMARDAETKIGLWLTGIGSEGVKNDPI